MRDIKFRAWDKEQNKMRSDGFSIHYNGQIKFADSIGSKDFILMQYTGLKDKNGVEIYEEDIIINVEFPHDKTIVDFNDYSFEALDANKDNILSFKQHLIEVIGNIYENNELLEE